MRYFVDAEFNGFGGELVSFAAVPEAEADPPFYEAIVCEHPLPWVRKHVLPVIQTRPRSMSEVASMFAAYLEGDRHPVLVADWPEDIAHAARLLTDGEAGRLLQSAVEFQLLAASDFSSDKHSKVPHNAYYDALALRSWVLARTEPKTR